MKKYQEKKENDSLFPSYLSSDDKRERVHKLSGVCTPHCRNIVKTFDGSHTELFEQKKSLLNGIRTSLRGIIKVIHPFVSYLFSLSKENLLLLSLLIFFPFLLFFFFSFPSSLSFSL
ncbi:hypothetical protein CSUI_008790 [Cystoisospora suis]|uniref:Transmembrane protein n=1 Tax=Cystoisospora suis TaxID=483139 RepID=A0A2C6KJU3_9APIC|nr:hypothetical protein CSUI_008790 [Cystoisospora suis]